MTSSSAFDAVGYAVHARPVACPSLIGRDRELELLHATRRALAKSQAALVLIGGEAGIGKSRVLAQFLRGAGDRRLRTTVSADCLEHAPQPFGPMREVIAALAAVTHAPLPPVLARFVARDTTSETVEKAELFAAVTAFLRERARDRATIVTIEDLHWSDATTLEFLGYLASRIAGARLLVIATYRSDESQSNDVLSATIARALRNPTTYRLDLTALKEPHLRALLHGALDGHGQLDREIVDDIVERADGNPFFGEELLKSALERSGNTGRSNLPISIRATIIERLRSFSPDERRTIDRAAVLGMHFDPHILARIMDASLESILPALRRARDANIIVEEDGERARFRFRHALTRQAVYDNLLIFDARHTHQTIFQTIEAFDAEGEFVEELAYHAWEARDREKARRYNELAGDRAAALFALPQARVCYERALETAANRDEEARLLARLSRVMTMLGHIEKAIELYDLAIAASLDVADYGQAAILVAYSAADRNNSGDATSVAFGTTFLDRYGPRVPVGPRDQLIAMLARLAVISFDADVAVELLSRIEAPGELSVPARQNVLLTRAELAQIASDTQGWAQAAVELIDVLPSITPFTQIATAYTLAQAASYHARDDLVERAFAQIARTEGRADIDVLRSYAEAVRALDHYARGHLEQAREAIVRANEAPELHVSDSVLAGVAPFVADALDDDSLMPARLEALFADVRLHARHGDDVSILGGSAAWLLRRNRRREAMADLRQGLTCLGRPLASSRAFLVLAAEHLEVAELPALVRFTEVGTYAVEDSVGRANACALGALIAQRSGDAARAVDFAITAARLYATLGRPLLKARCLEIGGRVGEAREIYTHHGAKGYLKRLGVLPAASEAARYALSEREHEVATLVAAGLGNLAIAERMMISKKTVEKHVTSIYDKLGVRSRAQVAGLLARSRE